MFWCSYCHLTLQLLPFTSPTHPFEAINCIITCVIKGGAAKETGENFIELLLYIVLEVIVLCSLERLQKKIILWILFSSTRVEWPFLGPRCFIFD